MVNSRRRIVALLAASVALGSTVATASGAGHPAQPSTSTSNAAPYVILTPSEVRVGNGLFERQWQRAGFATTSFVDKRTNENWAHTGPDFTIAIGGVPFTSATFLVSTASTQQLPAGGLRVTLELSNTGTSGALDTVVGVTRTLEVFPGVAGVRSQTTLHLSAPTPLKDYSLDQVDVGAAVATRHAFRAGSDWREPGWAGPKASVGDAHLGDYHEAATARAGQATEGPGEWLSLARGSRSLFMVMERNDQPSSRVKYDGSAGSLVVDPGHDLTSLGPIESDVHAENPTVTGRVRIVGPGDVALEPAFVGVSDHSGDEAWQFHRYLGRNGSQPAGRQVVFNTNGTDANLRSTGAKDDVDLSVIQTIAPKLRALGVDTFVLDDGWQAASGDWCPDSPKCPEPRWDGTSKTAKFRPRFPDSDFIAVRKAIAPMRLGLWMSPMEFNPAAHRFKAHPEQTCAPVGTALALANIPMTTSSYEAGVGAWGPSAIPYIEGRIRYAIEHWGVTYFKFDFMVWLDCLSQGDFFYYRDAFVAMLDRLIVAHPEVQFQIDETNDYRLFPFESTTRGSTWFLNGSPSVPTLLHTLWTLSPWVPAQALGAAMLTADPGVQPVSTQMAAALLSSPTYFSDPRKLPMTTVNAARPWVELLHHNADAFNGVVYPLLADPLKNRWTGLQSWNPETATGAVLAFRQQSALPRITLALVNIPDGKYEIRDAITGRAVSIQTAAQLREGLSVTIPKRNGSEVFLIRPLTSATRDPRRPSKS